MDLYKRWLVPENTDKQTIDELISIKEDCKEIEDRFYRDLEFGTGGLRGVIGAGTNRMNIYTVRRATQGLANYIKNSGSEAMGKGVTIAYDSRHFSTEFAWEAANVLSANNIKVNIFESLRPTPELSFAVRFTKAFAGIVITASHNPAKYNGYKVYNEDGGQIPPETASIVLNEIEKTDIFDGINLCNIEESKAKGLINIIGKEVDDAYLSEVYKQAINKDEIKDYINNLKVVYTPLHGSGNKLVRGIFKMCGFNNIIVVKEQEEPDPKFSTVKSPNPEETSALEIAVKYAVDNDADIVIGTDPDSDRIGVAVKTAPGEYQILNGNQVGVLLLNYVLENKSAKGEIPKNAVVVKTIVSTEMADKVAENFGVEIVDVLTGFKFIGDRITEYEKDGSKQYLFGFEESCGYLAGTYARDKDAVVASMLFAEMTAWYNSKGISVMQALDSLYDKYGYFYEKLEYITMEGKDGMAKINGIMQKFREDMPKQIAGYEVVAVADYISGLKTDLKTSATAPTNLPKSNVLVFNLADGSKVTGRPSGTEPKIKFYYSIKAECRKCAEEKYNKISGAIAEFTK